MADLAIQSREMRCEGVRYMPDNASADAFSDPKSTENGLVFVDFCNPKGVSKMLMVLSDAIKMGLTGGNYGFFEANKHV